MNRSPDEKTPLPYVKRPAHGSTRAVFWRNVYLAATRTGVSMNEALMRADYALQMHDQRFREPEDGT